MTDPMQALLSYVEALRDGSIEAEACSPQSSLCITSDQANGSLRLTYARIVTGEVKGIAMYCVVDPVDGCPCLQTGYAVVESCRNQGVGAALVRDSLQELQRNLNRVGVREFYVEAVVGTDNAPSKRIASALLSDSPQEITDQFSGEPALQYLRKFVPPN